MYTVKHNITDAVINTFSTVEQARKCMEDTDFYIQYSPTAIQAFTPQPVKHRVDDFNDFDHVFSVDDHNYDILDDVCDDALLPMFVTKQAD